MKKNQRFKDVKAVMNSTGLGPKTFLIYQSMQVSVNINLKHKLVQSWNNNSGRWILQYIKFESYNRCTFSHRRNENLNSC